MAFITGGGTGLGKAMATTFAMLGARVAIAALLAVVILGLCLGPLLAIIAVVALGIVTALMACLSQRQIGGQTGDVLGAVEQISEIVILLVALR